MKKLLTPLLLIFVFASSLFGKQIDLHTAIVAGQNFLRYKTDSPVLQDPSDLILVYKATSNIINPFPSATATTYFYVFNVNHGFVIVSGDDRVVPILGYSDEKEFRTDHMANAVAKWFEGYKSQIRYAIDHDLKTTPEIKTAWEELISGDNSFSNSGGRNRVAPLLHTTWDQPAPYNELCPGGSVTGCVATAMAQVMKFWNYPATGTGFHSFNDQHYGTLSANFGSTTYNWGNMPNEITSSNNAIATLMYHCGVSVDMEYSPEVSGAWVIENSPTPEANSEYAFKNYFGYANTLHGIQREDYSDSQWNSAMKAEIDASRPILYDGFGNGGGHCFVSDGYDANSLFHFNWGWSGYYNGYFETDALNPGGTGTGGGTGGYNSGQEAVIGIKPPDGGGGGGSNSYALKLYADLVISSGDIYYGEAFNVSTNIWNDGIGNFAGDYGAAVFDADNNFVDFIEIKTDWTLDAGFVYQNNVSFATTGLLSMLPGTYYIAVFNRPTDGDWSIIGNGEYYNLVQINVYNPNAIELYSDMYIQQGTTLTQGRPVTVNLNILNDGSETFYGSYSVDLYDIDGTWVENIGEVNEPNGLPSGYLYLDPFLTFESISLDAPPGTYLLALTHQWDGGDWELSGSSYFQNPIFITVKAEAVQPDVYENNDAFAVSYTLPINFSGNAATKNTVGSNCHNGSDYDFYKIVLPASYDYSLTARLHDSYNSGNGNTYTLDGQVSYSFDGQTWSDAFDDIIDGNILVHNGGTVYFFVTPYFLGQTGNYLLDMNMTRSPTTATKEIVLNEAINVFPNPATTLINVDLSQTKHDFHHAQLIDQLGRVVYSTVIHDPSLLKIPVDQLSNGNYVLRLNAEDGIVAKSVMICK